MKMAKASEADMNMAMDIAGALDLLGQRFLPCMPEAIEVLGEDDESEPFDRDDDAQCGRAMRYLLGLADRASLSRVIYGAAVMLDPKNKLVDPSADTIEHHPEALVNAKDAARYRWLRSCRGMEHDPLFTVQHEMDGTLWGGDLDVAIDQAMGQTNESPMPAPEAKPAIDIKGMRASFESWARSKGCPPDALEPLRDGSYGTTGTLAGMWASWQAASDSVRARHINLCQGEAFVEQWKGLAEAVRRIQEDQS